MKKIIIILILGISILSITGCAITSQKSDALKFKEEYEKENGKKSKSGNTNRSVTISKDNPFIYRTAEDIAKKIDNDETFIVYFGFSTCPWCRSIIEQLIKCAADYNVEEIYYVDVLDIRDVKKLDNNQEIVTDKTGTKGYQKLLKQLDNVLEDYTITDDNDETVNVGEKRIYAPNVVAIVDGNATKLEDGISDDLKDPYAKLTDKMKKETYNKFKCIFECLEEKENICTKKTC